MGSLDHFLQILNNEGTMSTAPEPFTENARRKNLLWLFSAPLTLALLGLLIWTNPYGREISSSLPAWGTLPIVVALLTANLIKLREISGLWSTDKLPLAALVLITSLSLVFLWLAEHTTFYIVVTLTAFLVFAWIVGKRINAAFFVFLSLASAGIILLGGGGSFPSPGPDDPAWLRIGLVILSTLATVLVIFLSAALLYTGIQGSLALNPRRLAWRLALAVVLICASTYPVFWEGIWSAAHARVFEDHLPFVHFLVSLISGLLLALTLRGWRRLAGPAFVCLGTGAAILALIWGWNISAFELTRQRADRVDEAIAQFHQDNGRYPAGLGELTPAYLLSLPQPVVVRHGSWCYQGGEDYYRLGYVSGQFTYFEADFQVKIHAQAGAPPPGFWICNQWAAKYEAGKLGY
jgi:hypothetical protein